MNAWRVASESLGLPSLTSSRICDRLAVIYHTDSYRE
jgi:hypothetical protein